MQKRIPDKRGLSPITPLTPWGTPIEFGLGNLIPDVPDLGKPTDRLWGRKGPDFPGRNPGW